MCTGWLVFQFVLERLLPGEGIPFQLCLDKGDMVFHEYRVVYIIIHTGTLCMVSIALTITSMCSPCYPTPSFPTTHPASPHLLLPLTGESAFGVVLSNRSRLLYTLSGHLQFWITLVVLTCGAITISGTL